MFQIIKNTASVAAKSTAFDRFVKLLENVDGQKPGFLRVLTYHRIDEPTRRPWLDPGLISASPKDFDEQIAYLATYYQIVTISDVLTAIKTRTKKDLPPRAVLVTFDDGYYDFEEQAWPILRRYRIPATLFVPTAYPDHPERTFWWDDLYQALQNTNRKDKLNTPTGTFSLSNAVSRNHAYQRLKNYMKTLKHTEAILTVRELCSELAVPPATNSIMSWDSLRKLSQDGLTLGAHTRTHPLLNRISLDEARDEAIGSFKDLKREIGFALPIFAYPGGEVSNDVASMLEREGFCLAFTTKRGVNNINHMKPFRIQRINVGGRTSLPVLRAQLLSWAAHFNRLQSRLDA
ncbi:MAG TPA: polysaccharide deacetylase family protein [Anaerolineales bacterium]|nr:polysaccharide deacetylase family protein [Anaerolineales bacterium]